VKDASTVCPCGIRLLRSITRLRDRMDRRGFRFGVLLKLAAPFTDRAAPEFNRSLRIDRHRRRNMM
jgi:hypothetical protein